MAEENKEELLSDSIVKEKGGIMRSKALVIGLPLFIVQLVLVYFITANILLSKVQNNTVEGGEAKKAEKVEEEATEDEESSEVGKFIYPVEDIVVNPAGTNGQRYVLISLGFDLKSEEDKKLFEEREIMIKDLVITTISAKTLEDLNSPTFRDAMKKEIIEKVKKAVKEIKINTIYFSKYIIQ